MCWPSQKCGIQTRPLSFSKLATGGRNRPVPAPTAAKKNPATGGVSGAVPWRGRSLGGLCGVLLMRHGTLLGPIANHALELLPVGYIANHDLYEPHRHIAGRTAWMDSSLIDQCFLPDRGGSALSRLSVTEARSCFGDEEC